MLRVRVISEGYGFIGVIGLGCCICNMKIAAEVLS